MPELIIAVGHTEDSLPIDFARRRVIVASLREGGEVRNAVRQPETLRVIGEQYPCARTAVTR